MLEWADHYRKTTQYSATDIRKPDPKPQQPETDTTSDAVKIKIDDGLFFMPHDDQPYRQVRNLIPNFNEAVKGE